MLLMGKSTLSTGPCSMSQTVSLPEGSIVDDYMINDHCRLLPSGNLLQVAIENDP